MRPPKSERASEIENKMGDAVLRMFKKNSPLFGFVEKESVTVSPPRLQGKSKTSFSGLKVLDMSKTSSKKPEGGFNPEVLHKVKTKSTKYVDISHS